MVRLKQFIGGRFQTSHNAQQLPVFNPATGSQYAECPLGSAQDINDAVASAQLSLTEWSSLKPSQRAAWLHKLADAIQDNFERFVHCESRDTGKPVQLVSEIEIPRVIENFRFFAHVCQQSLDHAFHAEAGLNYTVHQALGVVGIISPWNLPLYLLSWKIAPALASGNCVVAKPSEVTPMSANLLAETAKAIGFPSGVLNIVHGNGEQVGRALVEHPQVKAISFTGSTKVGKDIAQRCAADFKKVTLEMGGKNPSIVFADAPKVNLIPTLIRSAFQNSGQICLAGSRLLLQDAIYESFKQQFVAQTQALQLGDPSLPETRLGPVISQVHYEKILHYLELAKQEGGRVLCGGKAIKHTGEFANGWYIEPTIIEGLPMSSRFCQEEIFGPVVSFHRFTTESQAIEMANDSNYGLSSSVWTSDLNRAQRMSSQLQTGIVWINTWLQRDLRTPFGGMKQSGLGREGGLDAMRFFSEVKTICLGNA